MTTGPSRTLEMSYPNRPVSICGIGAVSGYGWGEKLLREGLYTSESAVRCHSGFSPPFDDDWGWLAMVDDAGNPDDGTQPHDAGRTPRRARSGPQRLRPRVAAGWRGGARPRCRSRRRRPLARVPPPGRRRHDEAQLAGAHALDRSHGIHEGIPTSTARA